MKNPELKDIKAAYEVADENGKKMLRALYPEVFTTDTADNRPVTERIKTFEDACNALGGGHPFVKSLNGYVNHIHEEDAPDSDIVAFLKLRIVAAALNEGVDSRLGQHGSAQVVSVVLYPHRAGVQRP